MTHDALIHPSAEIAEDVTIGPWSVIGENVKIDSGCVIESHCVISGPTHIGKDNHFHSFCSIGADSQDKKFNGEHSELIIGDRNVFREFCSVHRGTKEGGSKTLIGDDNLLMNYVHVAHDCLIGHHNIFSNNATLAGHVVVGNYVTMGGLSAAHQFVKIGDHAFVAGKSGVYMDIIPFVLAAGSQSTLSGLNTVGLKRRGFSSDRIKQLKQLYQILFNKDLKLADAIAAIQTQSPESSDAQLILSFINQSTRGLVRPKRTHHATA